MSRKGPEFTPLSVINAFRERIDDTGADVDLALTTGYTYKWQQDDTGLAVSNSLAIAFLNETVSDFSLRRGGFEDSTDGDVCRIAISPDVREYAYHEWVYTIEQVILESTMRPLRKKTGAALDGRSRRRTAPFYNARTANWRAYEGEPCQYAEDIRQHHITLDANPTTDDALLLEVTRRSLDWFSVDELKPGCHHAIAEPSWMHQEALIQGMLARAYKQLRDCEIARPELGAAAEMEFTRLVGPSVDARTLENRRYNANLSTRVRPFSYETHAQLRG